MTDIFKFNTKKINISKWLEENYGGKWTYDYRTTWWCDDDKRHMSRVASCSCDDICNHSPSYYIYGDGTPERIIL